MSTRKNETITSDVLTKEIANWVEQDSENPGAWNMFILVTLKKLKYDYNVTMQYLSQITKDQFDFICEAFDEVVHHFQKIEMIEHIESLYQNFYGNDKDTDLYRENIAILRACIK